MYLHLAMMISALPNLGQSCSTRCEIVSYVVPILMKDYIFVCFVKKRKFSCELWYIIWANNNTLVPIVLNWMAQVSQLSETKQGWLWLISGWKTSKEVQGCEVEPGNSKPLLNISCFKNFVKSWLWLDSNNKYNNNI